MQPNPASHPMPPDPRTLPGRLGERYYIRPEPNTALLKITIGLLYLFGIGIIAIGGAIGGNLAATEFIEQALKFSGITPSTITDLTGALIGMGIGALYAIPVFARAQMLGLYIRIEENTRLSKDLLYLLLINAKK